MDGRQVRAAQPLGQARRRARHEPVVTMDDVEAHPLSELAPRGMHVRVHPLDPGDEGVEVARHLLLHDAVDVDARAQLHLLVLAAPAGEHVHLQALRDERLRQLAHVARETARDDRRVLPREDEDARGHGSRGAPSGRPPRS
jgi:hypothetical protein